MSGDEGDAREGSEVIDLDAERERRLDPANRPDNAEVDNTDADLPTVRAFEEERGGGDDVEGSAGSSDPSAAFRDIEVSDEEREEIERERERRLAPENRPEHAEVDNT